MLGYSPLQVDEMTTWEFECAVHGYNKAHSSEKDSPPPMSDDELAELGIEGLS